MQIYICDWLIYCPGFIRDLEFLDLFLIFFSFEI